VPYEQVAVGFQRRGRSRSHGPVIDDDNVDITLPALNDSGHPFAEIADLIERNA
jgi:hypothetical protein